MTSPFPSTTSGQPRYLPRAIEPSVLAELRHRDDAGRTMRPFTVAAPSAPLDADGSPLRCCLEAAHAGDRVALVGYAPLRRWAAGRGVDPGAYDEVEPVFIHADPCPGPDTRPEARSYPHARPGALRTLRRYDCRGTISGGSLLEIPEDATTGFDEALDEAFADSEVAVVHVRAVEHGCFQFVVERPRPR